MNVVCSVIVPCYNVERWLKRALDSILAALPEDSEVIAVDDGSTDSTLAILREREGRDSRIAVIGLDHGGVSRARNRALDRAKGKYLFFVDPDDWVERDFFSAMIAKLEGDAADVCVCAYDDTEDGETTSAFRPLRNVYCCRDNAAIVREYVSRIFGYSFDDIREWYSGRPLFANREMAAVWRMVYRRELVERNHVRFDERIELYEDAMFNTEYLLVAKSMTAIDRAIYHVTCRNSGAMRTVPRHSRRYVTNKLRLLEKRDELNARQGGALTPLYEGTCVLSAIELLSLVLGGKAHWSDLSKCLKRDSIRRALAGFPRSWKRPLVALASLFLLYYSRRVK